MKAIRSAARGAGGVGMLALLVFCVFLGSFGSLVFAPYVPVQYAPSWGRAAWIGPGRPAAMAYYRTNLVLERIPVKAQMQIAAPEGFDLYVNGNLVTDTRPGSPSFNKAAKSATAAMVLALASGGFNIASHLKAGKNILAIKVTLQSRPPRAELIVSGSWRDQTGQVGDIASDNSWRVAIAEEWQAGRSILWHSPDFSDLHWPNAVKVSRPLEAPMQPFDFSPDLYPTYPMQLLDIYPGLFQIFPRGDWIWSQDRAAQAVAFRRNFVLAGDKIREAWIGISSDANWVLAINGHALSPDSAVVSGANGIFMDTYEVSRYLRLDENTVELGMLGVPPLGPPRLAVSLMADVDGKKWDFSSDARWLAQSASTASVPVRWYPEAARGLEWTRAEVISSMQPVPLAAKLEVQTQFGFPTVRIAQLSAPWTWLLERSALAAAWIAGLFAANVLLTGLVAALAGPSLLARLPTVWSLWTHACAAGTVILGFVLLLQFDVRVPRNAVLQPAVFFAVWGLTVLWTVLTIVFLRARIARMHLEPGVT